MATSLLPVSFTSGEACSACTCANRVLREPPWRTLAISDMTALRSTLALALSVSLGQALQLGPQIFSASIFLRESIYFSIVTRPQGQSRNPLLLSNSCRAPGYVWELVAAKLARCLGARQPQGSVSCARHADDWHEASQRVRRTDRPSPRGAAFSDCRRGGLLTLLRR